MSKTIYVKLYGGVGNQLFCYAFAIALKQLGNNVIIDASIYNDIKETHKDNYFGANGSKISLRNLEIEAYNLSIRLQRDTKYFLNLRYRNDIFYIPKVTFFKFINFIIVKLFKKNTQLETDRYKYRVDECPISDMYNPILDKFRTNTFNNLDFCHGYYQNIEYLMNIKDIIKKEFVLKTPLDGINKSMQERIKNTKNSVMMHIRRGDYITYSNSFVTLGSAYYNACLKLIHTNVENPFIFIFSNDIQWCQKYAKRIFDFKNMGGGVCFVSINGEGDAIKELELMRSCKHFIIANSTFSWWAAYLGDNVNKQVYMPSNFFNNKKQIPTARMLKVDDNWKIIDYVYGQEIKGKDDPWII